MFRVRDLVNTTTTTTATTARPDLRRLWLCGPPLPGDRPGTLTLPLTLPLPLPLTLTLTLNLNLTP